METEEEEFIITYDLKTFPMRVQSLNRTLIDKVFAVCDYYLQGKAHRNARHLYDIYKLSECVEIDDDFLKLVEEVRTHRIALGREIAPAAPLDINILELAQKICKEDFYKEDYRETTLKLISESLEYEILKKQMVNDLKNTYGYNNAEATSKATLTAYCFLLFVLLYFPCIATIAAIKGETGSWKWAGFAAGYTTLLAWVVSALVFQIGSLFM